MDNFKQINFTLCKLKSTQSSPNFDKQQNNCSIQDAFAEQTMWWKTLLNNMYVKIAHKHSAVLCYTVIYNHFSLAFSSKNDKQTICQKHHHSRFRFGISFKYMACSQDSFEHASFSTGRGDDNLLSWRRILSHSEFLIFLQRRKNRKIELMHSWRIG